ncbi:hypothetical protein BASA81_008266 [Batrachochytrium salamandrivorans]|nr:hypothetical protein BASA81_008266 [Batrachochytrium salamandrivorans]
MKVRFVLTKEQETKYQAKLRQAQIKQTKIKLHQKRRELCVSVAHMQTLLDELEGESAFAPLRALAWQIVQLPLQSNLVYLARIMILGV